MSATPEERKMLQALLDSRNGGGTLCPRCGCCEMIPDDEPCWNCGGEGFIDFYEDDPLWYDEDDVEACEICAGGPLMICLGGCDDDGNHKPRPGPALTVLPGESIAKYGGDPEAG